MEGLLSRSLRALLRRLGAGRAVHARELASSLCLARARWITATFANARLAGPAADVPLTARSASATDAAACFRTLGLESTHRLEMAPKALAQCGHCSFPGPERP